MKKLFFSTALLATAFFGAFAEEGDGYRRTWDFTKGWSVTTIEKLEADASNWEPQATGFQNNPTAMTANETPWVMVNGEKEPIAEMVGMTINSSLAKAKHCQICTTGSGLADVPCFWLNGKGDAVSVKVPAGENVRFGYTAHGANDRGFKCSTGFADANGATQFTNADNQQIHEVELINSNEGESTLTLTTVNGGSHIYYIIIGEGDAEETIDKNYKVAYLYDGTYNGTKDGEEQPAGWLANGGLETDMAWMTLESFDAEAIDYSTVGLTSAELNDSLLSYDVVVLSEAVSSSNALAKGVLEIVNKVPMLNLKSFFYKSGVWGVGAGKNPSPKSTTVIVAEDFKDDKLFSDVAWEGDDESTIRLFDVDDVDAVPGNFVQGYTANETGLFANDEVFAMTGAGDINAIHVHSAARNAYMLLPLSSDNYCYLNDNATTIITNAIGILAATKTKVSAVVTPVISMDNYDGGATVSITCSNKLATIYYTLDGTDPTTASTVYSEPFDVTTEGVVVKALAVAQGYDNSAIASAEVKIMSQAAAPSFASVDSEGFTTITLTAAEGASIYFNFVGGEDAATSQLYAEPIVLKEPATLTAFATGDDVLQSAAVSRYYSVGGIPAVKDTIAHFTANEEAWFTNVKIYDYAMVEQEIPTSNWAAKAAYYWGKSGWSYYSTEEDHTEIVYEEDGVTPLKSLVNPDQDSVKTVYKIDPTAVKYVYSTVDTQWRLRSQGQAFTGETNVSALSGVGNNAANYYAETAFDEIGSPSKGKLTFGGKKDGERFTGSVESTVKFEGEFDVVTYLTNGGTSAIVLELQTSTDGETWATVDTLSSATTQRYYKKDRFHISATEPVYVRVAQTGGGSKGQLYDIYVITTDGTTGIEAISANAPSATIKRIYDLQGRRVNSTAAGQLYIVNGKKVVVK